MKQHDFIKCLHHDFPSWDWGQPKIINSPVNLSMCLCVVKDREESSAFPNIFFGAGIPFWVYEQEKDRDADYNRIMERIGLTEA